MEPMEGDAGEATDRGSTERAFRAHNGYEIPPLSGRIVITRKPTVDGGLHPEVVRRFLRKYRHTLRACYQDGLERNPKLEGALLLRLEVGAAGTVVAASIPENTIEDEAVVTCFQDAARDWTFPEPREQKSVTIQIPLRVEPPVPRETTNDEDIECDVRCCSAATLQKQREAAQAVNDPSLAGECCICDP